jgi:C4-dicarboxylate-binding protein DctP
VLKIHYLTEEERRMWRDELAPVYQKYVDFIGEDLLNELLEKE